ncbi:MULTISPECIES: tryptophan synthase subunit alpha [unclassified Butyrivibrio]|uniref:tryptophan synthase subunit alpha n=1 Tax=unclassified Butyrivibrio TaxID=2639466 RepID=UPI0003B75480|nr:MULTISPECIES: tryptophan synthase subunit alpha [unclassified Butyrivibrio]SDB58218.1 tryptophan synthase, alpha chain [Butyrivibrio sp. INlla16]SEL68805.1 tryptophan synthase, alpha chain [Butyrivibrio sp. ob235]
MSKIAEAFNNKKAFIPFVTCGDPDLDTTKNILRELQKNGADLIELGIPFSDPTAEGPVIQGANIRALKNGITTDDIFAMVEEIRSEITVPMVFMTYANVIFSYGMDRFFEKCQKIGMDGVILPDVPFEEKSEFDKSAGTYGVDFISMVAPTSEDRIAMIAKEAKGFIYIVSSLGVTGTRTSITTNVKDLVDQIRKVTDVPCAVGFGISTPEQASNMAEISDGAIVGSAIVRIIEQNGKDAPAKVGEFVKNMKSAYKAS